MEGTTATLTTLTGEIQTDLSHAETSGSSGGDPNNNDNNSISGSNDDHDDDEEVLSSHSSATMQFDPLHGIREPDANDILCGRGRSTSDHPANVRFRTLVNHHKEAYQKAKRRDEKSKITCELVDLLRSTGRFVLFDPKTQLWYEVSEEYAREKVSHSLRSRPIGYRRIKPKLKRKNTRRLQHSPALEDVVQRIIQDQQSILKGLMHKESNRMAAEAIMRATLGQAELS